MYMIYNMTCISKAVFELLKEIMRQMSLAIYIYTCAYRYFILKYEKYIM